MKGKSSLNLQYLMESLKLFYLNLEASEPKLVNPNDI